MTRRLFLGVLFLPLFSINEQPRVKFLRPPAFATGGFVQQFYVHVPLRLDNRLLTISAYDGEFRVQYSERDLSEERQRTIWDLTWQLPAGEIVLLAAVFGKAGEIARDRHLVTVT